MLKNKQNILEKFESTGGELWLKSTSEENGDGGTGALLADETEEEISDDDQFIRCAQCMGAVTRPENRVTMHGAHRHTFANPHGIVFEIGLFHSADGCRYAGPPTDEFSWFRGYAWRVAVCKNCLLHLGWLFDSPGKGSFNGLITDRLVYPD